MRLLDLNILLYAVNAKSPDHRAAKQWVEAAMNGSETIALPWVVVLGFLRLATSRHVFASPLDTESALAVVDGWMDRPNVVTLDPGEQHWAIFADMISRSGTAGNHTTDAHIAALAVENGCELCSTDADFARYPQVRWVNPLADDDNR